ncbi:MAG: hypothetical protein F6K24_57055 [Okeania sp. SIO2D1]|nr:hypothetical protein [Okeania sp. SIO2D1]
MAKFAVTAIDPVVNPDDPTAFPLRLEFNTPTASFEMRSLSTDVAQTATGEEEGLLVEGNENQTQEVVSLSAAWGEENLELTDSSAESIFVNNDITTLIE